MRAHVEAGRHDDAARLLRIAQCNPATAAEAHVWESMQILGSDPHRAYRLLNSAVCALPDNADLHLLQARAAELAGEPELAHQLTENALYVDPLSPAIRAAAWRSRARMLPRDALQRQILKALPDITAGTELATVLPMLPPGAVGVVAYDPIRSELHGWAIDPTRPHDVVQLECLALDERMTLHADRPSALLQEAGLPGGHGGIRLKVPPGTYRLDVQLAGGGGLSGSPLVPLAPVVNPPAPKGDPRKQPVDILIPVYRGEAETLACIRSVLAARSRNGVKHEVIVLDDASPEPGLIAALIGLAQSGAITLVRHPANLGFIRGMNRGMVMHPERDVIWLNADTLVHGNWVDRLRQAAYSAADIASVTPFSNNGELMSFPEPSMSHPMPDAAQLQQLDTLAAAGKASPVALDVGNGFCLYLRRHAIAAVGLLDEIHMARGYGEETDWCLRATAGGWRHVGAPNVFVAHRGEVSFGAEKRARVKQNLRIIEQRYPWAEQAYVRHTLSDPLAPARERLQRSRLRDCARTPGSLCLSQEYRQGRWWAVLSLPVLPFAVQCRYPLPGGIPELYADLSRLGESDAIAVAGSGEPPTFQDIVAKVGLTRGAEPAAPPTRASAAAVHRAGGAYLIGDAADALAVDAWLTFVRDIAASHPGMHLLLPHVAPGAQSLYASGVVLRGDVPPNADAAAHVRAAGCHAVLHLNGNGTPYDAARVAERSSLPLLLPPASWRTTPTPATGLDHAGRFHA
jgi:GT2 family glycosyltransferase